MRIALYPLTVIKKLQYTTFGLEIDQVLGAWAFSYQVGVRIEGPHNKRLFTNYVDTILAFFDRLLPSVNIFYSMNVDKK